MSRALAAVVVVITLFGGLTAIGVAAEDSSSNATLANQSVTFFSEGAVVGELAVLALFAAVLILAVAAMGGNR